MSKIEAGSYVKLVRLVQQETETPADLESITAMYGEYVGQVGEVTASEDIDLTVRFTDGEEFDVYSNEIEIIE